MFFSVDVETSGLNPWEGELLTVGCIPVTEDGIILDEPFYARLEYSFLYNLVDPSTDTLKWWSEQEVSVIEEAFHGIRESMENAASRFVTYMKRLEPEWSNRIFVANPVSFDKMWCDYWFSQTAFDVPYHYRSLCLRSMKYGLVANTTYGSDRSTHSSEIPHHALSDARAQALDLQTMLEMKKHIL